MFWIAPIHTPIIPVRRSPKYFHVSESGPTEWRWLAQAGLPDHPRSPEAGVWPTSLVWRS
ncbi:hypothetical protein I552_6096 [Mycobacterium xenopi 3993]|nr:hypothetical protein I552_6096 [Mycobacterium xenopi 3993]